MESAPTPTFDGLDETHRALVVVLRTSVAPILANNLLPHFTDHSVGHSDRLLRLIGELVAPIQNGELALTQDELVLLYSACYLHDIGLQYERAHLLGVIPAEQMPQAWEDLSESTQRDLLRQYHHQIAAKMVQLSAGSAESLIGMQLTEAYYPARLACLCESHCIDMDADIDRYQQITTDGPRIRMRLLSGLLRVADILDESRRRALRSKARTLNLDRAAETHWWRHYYTEDVTFDAGQRLIKLHFDFPPDRLVEYSKVVPQIQVPSIKEEVARHQDVFHKNGVVWNVASQISCQEYSTTERMPDDVLAEMLKELWQRNSRRAHAQREADLQILAEAQPLLNRQREELERERERLLPSDYLRRLHDLARSRYEMGGARSAIELVSHAFMTENSALPATERLAIGIELAGWIQEIRQPDRALSILRRIEGIVRDDAIPRKRRKEFWHVAAVCLNAEAKYSDADVAITEAIAHTDGGEEKEALAAQRAEWRFLRGDIQAGLGAQETREQP